MNVKKIYKRDQGRKTRIGTGLVLLVIVVLGCVRLYQMLQGSPITVQTLVPVGLCGVLGLLIFWLLNKPNVADFLIASEGEIKKVSWSSRKEVTTSTLVVISVVVILAAFLFAVDAVFILIFSTLFGLY